MLDQYDRYFDEAQIEIYRFYQTRVAEFDISCVDLFI
jgi:hypothetical protein